MQTENKQPTKVVGGEVRFSYAYVHEAKTTDNGEKKYSVSLLIPKKNKVLVAMLTAGIEAAIAQGIKAKWGGKRPKNLKLPLRDGDEERENHSEYKGMYFITASNKNRPGLVDENCQKILDEDDFYSGCWGNFSINFFPFNEKGNVGVGAGLLNLQKTKDDEKLAGGSTPQEDFGGGAITTNMKFNKGEDENEDKDSDLPF